MSEEEGEIERLLRFVYLSPVGTVHMRRDGAVELINPVAVSLLMPLAVGGDLGNLLTLLERVAPGIAASVARFPGETGTIIERTELRVPSGQARPTVIALSIVAVDRDSVIAVLTDVTRAVEQERRLHTQEQRLRTIIDGAQEYAIFTLDRDGRLDEWNESLSRFTDLGREKVVGLLLETLFDARPRAIETAAMLEESLRAGVARYNGWLRSALRGPRSAEALVTPLVGLDGAPTGFGVVLHDTTLRTEYEQRLVKLATTDPLTGSLNRRAFLDAAELEVRRSVRYQRSLAVLMLDVDHFKSVNDRYGHDIGDQVLVKLADTCRRTVREMDVVARLGGEEFAVLAPETPLENAGALGERLRDALSKIEVETPSGALRITVSIGVAARSTTDAGDTFPNMLKRSDVALYQAKSSGRNRVVLEG